MTRILFVISCLSILLSGSAFGQSAETPRDGIAVLVVSPDGSDPNVAARIERDLRNMYDEQSRTDPSIPAVIEIESRFDVGNLSKGTLSKAERHFNKAQRAIEKKDYSEATDQLFRAQRFYIRAIPYSSNPALLREIFYYTFKTRQAMKRRSGRCRRTVPMWHLSGPWWGVRVPSSNFRRSPTGAATRCRGDGGCQANIDGGHVFIDGCRVGIVGRSTFVAPFLAAGPHFVEVRRVGYALGNLGL